MFQYMVWCFVRYLQVRFKVFHDVSWVVKGVSPFSCSFTCQCFSTKYLMIEK